MGINAGPWQLNTASPSIKKSYRQIISESFKQIPPKQIHAIRLCNHAASVLVWCW